MAAAKEQSNASVVRIEMTMKGRNFRRDKKSGELVVSDGINFESSFDVQTVNGRTAIVDNVDALFGAFRRNVAETVQAAAAAIATANTDETHEDKSDIVKMFRGALEVREGMSDEDREVFDAWFSNDRGERWPTKAAFAKEFGLTAAELSKRLERYRKLVAEASGFPESDAVSA